MHYQCSCVHSGGGYELLEQEYMDELEGNFVANHLRGSQPESVQQAMKEVVIQLQV